MVHINYSYLVNKTRETILSCISYMLYVYKSFHSIKCDLQSVLTFKCLNGISTWTCTRYHKVYLRETQLSTTLLFWPQISWWLVAGRPSVGQAVYLESFQHFLLTWQSQHWITQQWLCQVWGCVISNVWAKKKLSMTKTRWQMTSSSFGK